MADTPIFHEIARAEMRPDIYAGPNCDEHRAKWRCSSESDKSDNADLRGIALASALFPPGTRISISVPVCPDCDLPADHAMNGAMIGPCPCGFDWIKWTEGRFG